MPIRRLVLTKHYSMQHFIDFDSDGVIIADSDGAILSWSGGAQRIFGYEESDVLGKALTILMPKKYRSRHHRALAQVAAIGEPHSAERMMVREGLTRGGRPVFIECATFSWSCGQKTYFGALVRNVAEPDQAREMWRQSEVDARSLIEHIPGFLVTLDRDGTILFINRGLMGHPAQDVIGTTVYSYIEIADTIELRAAFAHTLETAETSQCAVSGPDSRGVTRSYNCQIGPIKRGDDIVSLVLIAQELPGRNQLVADLESKVDRQLERGTRYRLTHRELMVLNLAVESRPVTEISILLGISPLTVRKHLSNILSKMGAPNRAAAFVRAIREGIVK